MLRLLPCRQRHSVLELPAISSAALLARDIKCFLWLVFLRRFITESFSKDVVLPIWTFFISIIFSIIFCCLNSLWIKNYCEHPASIKCGHRVFFLFRSRGVVRIEAKMTFEPEKINIFNKNCQRGGKEVTCMSVVVCLRLDSMTKNKKDYRKEVGEWYLHIFCWLTYSAVGNFQLIVVVWTRGLVGKSGQVWFSQYTTKNQQMCLSSGIFFGRDPRVTM